MIHTPLRLAGATLLVSGLLASAALAAGLPALHPYRVADVNLIPRSGHSVPGEFATAGRIGIFGATDLDGGWEPWRSDGTNGGTYQLAEICGGECSSGFRAVAQLGSRLLFVASRDSGVADLWITDGTVAGTQRIAERVDAYWARPLPGRVVFLGFDAAHGSEPWVTDGTPAGTRLLVDVRPGPASSYVTSELNTVLTIGGRVVFSATRNGQTTELWGTDGTPAGTRSLPVPVRQSLYARQLYATANRLYFVEGSARTGYRFWYTDGSAAGTSSFYAGIPAGAYPTDFTGLGGTLLFAVDKSGSRELWRTNGTAKSTRRVTSRQFRDTALYYRSRTIRGRVYFSADDGQHGVELWSSDGTDAGTRLVRDVCPGECSGGFPYAVLGDRLLMVGVDGRGSELWITDGTAKGTRFLADLCPGSCSPELARDPAIVGQRAVFTVREVGAMAQLWGTDGTSQGTRLLARVPFNGGDAGARVLGAVIPAGFLFSGADAAFGHEPWITDGTPVGTRVVRDIATADVGGSMPTFFRSCGSTLSFVADDGIHGQELWRSDGTDAGTHFVVDLLPGEASLDGYRMYSSRCSGETFFFGQRGDGLDTLLASDGSAAGTHELVHDVWGNASFQMAPMGGKMYIAAGLDEFSEELLVSDGTPAGTRAVRDGQGQSIPDATLVVAGASSVFIAGDSGSSLWTTDGTQEGTRQLLLLDEGTAQNAVRPLIVLGDRLLYSRFPGELWSTGSTPESALRLTALGSTHFPLHAALRDGSRAFLFFFDGIWVSDGTAAGTRKVASTQADWGEGRVLSGVAYFAGKTPGGYLGLMRSDGTAAGTYELQGPEGERLAPSALEVFAGRLMLINSAGQGFELWESDGTSAGTRRVQRLGPQGSGIASLAAVGNRLFFAAHDRDHGWELWAAPAP